MSSDATLLDQLIRVAEAVMEQTVAGQIDWSPTNREGQFLASGPHSGLRVNMWLDEAEDPNVKLSVLNPRGQEVAELSSAWNVSGESPGAAPWNEILLDIFNAARRIAMKSEEVLNSTLMDLSGGAFKKDLDSPFS